MIIGNIVTEKKVNAPSYFNQVPSTDEIIYENLPKLILGFRETKKMYGITNMDINNNKIDKLTFWCFKENIDQDVHFSQLYNYIRYSHEFYFSQNYHIIDVDIINYNPRKLMKIVRRILQSKENITYKHTNGLYFILNNDLLFIINPRQITMLKTYTLSRLETLIKNHSSKFITSEDEFFNGKINLYGLDPKYTPILYKLNNL